MVLVGPVEATLGTTIFVILTIIVLFFDKLIDQTELLKYASEKLRSFHKMIQTLLNQLMIFGLTNFLIVLIKKDSRAVPNDYKEGLSFAQVMFFFIALSYVLQATFLMILSLIMSSRYNMFEIIRADELLAKIKRMTSISRYTVYLELFPISKLRNLVEFKIISKVLKDSHGLPDSFPFPDYFIGCFDFYVIKLLNLQVYAWTTLISVPLLNYIRIKAMVLDGRNTCEELSSLKCDEYHLKLNIGCGIFVCIFVSLLYILTRYCEIRLLQIECPSISIDACTFFIQTETHRAQSIGKLENLNKKGEFARSMKLLQDKLALQALKDNVEHKQHQEVISESQQSMQVQIAFYNLWTRLTESVDNVQTRLRRSTHSKKHVHVAELIRAFDRPKNGVNDGEEEKEVYHFSSHKKHPLRNSVLATELSERSFRAGPVTAMSSSAPDAPPAARKRSNARNSLDNRSFLRAPPSRGDFCSIKETPPDQPEDPSFRSGPTRLRGLGSSLSSSSAAAMYNTVADTRQSYLENNYCGDKPPTSRVLSRKESRRLLIPSPVNVDPVEQLVLASGDASTPLAPTEGLLVLRMTSRTQLSAVAKRDSIESISLGRDTALSASTAPKPYAMLRKHSRQQLMTPAFKVEAWGDVELSVKAGVGGEKGSERRTKIPVLDLSPAGGDKTETGSQRGSSLPGDRSVLADRPKDVSIRRKQSYKIPISEAGIDSARPDTSRMMIHHEKKLSKIFPRGSKILLVRLIEVAVMLNCLYMATLAIICLPLGSRTPDPLFWNLIGVLPMAVSIPSLLRVVLVAARLLAVVELNTECIGLLLERDGDTVLLVQEVRRKVDLQIERMGDTDLFANKEELLKKLFDAVDTKRTGLSRSSLKRLLGILHLYYSDDKVQRLFHAFDEDKDGVINFTDFNHLMHQEALTEDVLLSHQTNRSKNNASCGAMSEVTKASDEKAMS